MGGGAMKLIKSKLLVGAHCCYYVYEEEDAGGNGFTEYAPNHPIWEFFEKLSSS